jgi:hypothetical protein
LRENNNGHVSGSRKLLKPTDDVLKYLKPPYRQ